jgi:hypothetical protein
MILRIYNDWFLKQHWPVDLCNGEVLFEVRTELLTVT